MLKRPRRFLRGRHCASIRASVGPLASQAVRRAIEGHWPHTRKHPLRFPDLFVHVFVHLEPRLSERLAHFQTEGASLPRPAR